MVLVTVPLVSRYCGNFPEGFDLHLQQKSVQYRMLTTPAIEEFVLFQPQSPPQPSARNRNSKTEVSWVSSVAFALPPLQKLSERTNNVGAGML